MKNRVGDCRVIERGEVCGKLQLPCAEGGARAFEGEKSLVVQVSLEHAAVVAGCARHDRVGGSEVVDEARIASAGSNNLLCKMINLLRARRWPFFFQKRCHFR